MLDSDEEPGVDPAKRSYNAILRAASDADSFWKDRPFIVLDAVDEDENKVILINTGVIRNTTDEINSSYAYAIYMMHPIISTQYYTVIVCFGNQSWGSLKHFGFSWISTLFSIFPIASRKRLRKLYFVHPPKTVQAYLTLQMPFIHKRFWLKYSSISNLQLLYGHLEILSGKRNSYFPHAVQVADASVNDMEKPRVFGVSLQNLSLQQGIVARNCTGVPEVVVMMVSYLEDPDVILTKNLFIEQPGASELYNVVSYVETGEWSEYLTSDVYALATAFRLFFESFPVLLFGDMGYAIILDTYSTPKSREDIKDSSLNSTLQKILEKLSPLQTNLLKYILIFFDGVIQKARYNMMTATTMAKIFAPSFVKPKSWNATTYIFLKITVKLITNLLEDLEVFFPKINDYKKESHLRRQKPKKQPDLRKTLMDRAEELEVIKKTTNQTSALKTVAPSASLLKLERQKSSKLKKKVSKDESSELEVTETVTEDSGNESDTEDESEEYTSEYSSKESLVAS